MQEQQGVYHHVFGGSHTPTMEQAVLAGAALLDERVPGWREKINLNRLDLSDFRGCILGQLFGDFGSGVQTLLQADESASQYGFSLFGRFLGLSSRMEIDLAYEVLTSLWRREIVSPGSLSDLSVLTTVPIPFPVPSLV